jgi:uncharacterized surface protein with fasciclin (FAS1) repeats
MGHKLTAILTLVLASTCWAIQQPLTVEGLSPLDSASSSVRLSDDFSETIVSILSSSSQHTTLLRLLQRSKCIPMLAHIGNATIFAPTDTAWETWAKAHLPENTTRLYQDEVIDRRISDGMNEEDVVDELDNQNWALRQHLLYHMLNYTLSPADFGPMENASNITTHTTLLFPLADEPAHPRIPPPGAPWLPRGGDGMLGQHGQRLRYARAGSEEGQVRGRVGGDWRGEGGFDVWDSSGWGEKDGNETHIAPDLHGDKEDRRAKEKVRGVRWGTNGAVVGITGVLDTPGSIGELYPSQRDVAYKQRI